MFYKSLVSAVRGTVSFLLLRFRNSYPGEIKRLHYANSTIHTGLSTKSLTISIWGKEVAF